MGQKVNPHGMRVGVIKDWDSRWYAKDEKVGDLIVEDYNIRKFLKKTLYGAGVPKIEIERSNDVVTLFVHCARPGMVIGKDGAEVEKVRAAVEAMIGKKVKLNIVEVRSPDMDAQLVAENIAQQLEKRISHRRAMKNAMGRAMRAGAKGIKCCCTGRLGGREIAGVEHYHEGTIPLQTIRADIDYGFAEAATTYGRIGVKVWVYKAGIVSLDNLDKALKVNSKSKILKFWTLFIPQKKEDETDDAAIPGEIASAEEAPATEPQFEIAECCKPIPGDKVVGYRDPASGNIIVHKATCDELNRLATQFGRNIVKEEIKWSQHKAMSYLVTTELRGIDRQGILLDLAKVVSADFNINIREVNIHSHDGIFEGNVSLYVKDAESLHAVMDKLRKIKGIESVKRTLS